MTMAMCSTMSKWPIFPIRVFWRAGHWHKVPRFAGWQEHAAPAPNQIEQWWRAQAGNFGIELGGAGLVIIDADRHSVDGVAALDDLIGNQEWPPHLVVATAGNGQHHIFAQPDRPLGNARGALPDGVDVRGTGGWIVAPGSFRPDGASWRLVAGSMDEVPVLPEWLEEIIRQKGQRVSSAESLYGPQLATSGELPKPLYRKVLQLVPLSDQITRHHQRRVIGILNIAPQRTSHRNDGLNIAAFCMRELVPLISRAIAEELLLDVAFLNGYVDKDGVMAAKATIKSGVGSH
jgi:Bifunctional DNA primase/polymerase, N-terminal